MGQTPVPFNEHPNPPIKIIRLEWVADSPKTPQMGYQNGFDHHRPEKSVGGKFSQRISSTQLVEDLRNASGFEAWLRGMPAGPDLK